MLAVGLLVAIAGAGAVGARMLASGDDVPYDDIAACRRPAVASPPPVDEGPAVEARLVPVAAIDQAIGMAPLPDRVHALVVARTGKVWRLHLGSGATEQVLDLGDRVGLGPEGGLLAVAVDPPGRFAYLHYTDEEGTSHIVEYVVDGATLDRRTERRLLEVEHAGGIHNGGALHFGPDGALYAGFGNGGDRPSDAARVQDLGRLDGKIVRISPRPQGDDPYGVPEDNPFARRSGARPEIWAVGLRNPWQFSFDAATGDMWIGDVGSTCYEEVDVLATGASGADLGYPKFEAFHGFLDEKADGSTFPVYAYRHGADGCAVIGGVVYRGSAVPALESAYLMADFCTDRVRWLRRSAGGVTIGTLTVRAERVQSFARDLDGEVYLLSADRGVLRVVAP